MWRRIAWTGLVVELLMERPLPALVSLSGADRVSHVVSLLYCYRELVLSSIEPHLVWHVSHCLKRWPAHEPHDKPDSPFATIAWTPIVLKPHSLKKGSVHWMSYYPLCVELIKNVIREFPVSKWSHSMILSYSKPQGAVRGS